MQETSRIANPIRRLSRRAISARTMGWLYWFSVNRVLLFIPEASKPQSNSMWLCLIEAAEYRNQRSFGQVMLATNSDNLCKLFAG